MTAPQPSPLTTTHEAGQSPEANPRDYVKDKEIALAPQNSLVDKDVESGDGKQPAEARTESPTVTPEVAVVEPETAAAQRTTTAGSNKPYSAFRGREKALIVLCATMGGLFSPFTTNIYYPALDTIASDLHVSISKVNLSITTYMIFQAIAPTFVSTFTDTQGRRPTYIVGFAVFIGANIGLAFNKSYAGLLVLRCLQSCGSSGMVTLQQAIIADVVTSAERPRYIGITSITGIVAPSVAPIVGGALSQRFGWHAVFVFLLCLAAVYLVPMLLFLPETSRKIVGDGSTLPPRLNMSVFNALQSRRLKRQNPSSSIPPPRALRQRLTWPNPLPVLRIYTQLEYSLMLCFASISYAAWYAINASLTVQFNQIYHLSTTQQGLLFLPQAAGSILAAVTNTLALDRNYRRHARRHGLPLDRRHQISLSGFPIERARLEPALPLFVLNTAATVAYGWALHAEAPIAVPLVLLVLLGYSMMAGFNALSVLNVDINRKRAASASAAANLGRCLMGAGATAVVNPLILAVGRGWCFTITAAVQAVFLPVLWVMMRYGVEWRRREEEREREKAGEGRTGDHVHVRGGEK